MNQESRWQNGRAYGSCFFIPLIVLLAAGCGGSKGEVSGKVLYKGEPLSRGRVTFIHPDKGAFGSIIGKDGSYTVYKLPPGEVKIAVQSLRTQATNAKTNPMRQKMLEDIKSGKLQLPPEQREKMAPEPEPTGPTTVIPESYNDPEKSGLTYTVTGGKQTHDIELK